MPFRPLAPLGSSFATVLMLTVGLAPCRSAFFELLRFVFWGPLPLAFKDHGGQVSFPATLV